MTIDQHGSEQPPMQSPSEMLDTVLINIRRKNSIQRLSKQWAGAMDVSRAVVTFVTDRIPDANGEPLIHRCLRDALDASNRCALKHPGRAMMPAMFSSYIVSILCPCAEVLKYAVVCPLTNAVWDPFEETLHAFLTAHPAAFPRARGTASSERSMALFHSLCHRLIREADLVAADRTRETLVQEIMEIDRCFCPSLSR
jgi:hypothetical protein